MHCGEVPDTEAPCWEILLRKRQLPSSSVVVIPQDSSEGVSFSVDDLQKFAPHSLKILQESEVY